MTERKIKLGIVGAGIWGRNHALALTTPSARQSGHHLRSR